MRKSSERGHAQHGWLESFHTFSFADYYDPAHMGYRALRVINEDWIEGGEGFGTHPHRNMEILTYMLEGKLHHEDSMGNGSDIPVGDIQYMSAASGVLHSEKNASATEKAHLLQIWILPEAPGGEPRYGQLRIDPKEFSGKPKLLASPTGADGSLSIRRNVKLYSCLLKRGEETEFPLQSIRHAWIQMARGEADVRAGAGSASIEERLSQGDGAAVTGVTTLRLKGLAEVSEFLLFDLD